MNEEQRAAQMILADLWMMNCLKQVAKLNLPDCFIGAGFVRNKIWDVLHGYEQRTPLNDVDVVYFDRENANKNHDQQLEQQLLQIQPDVPWSVINLARIHLKYQQAPFIDSTHAISYWPEQPTCVGVRLDLDSGQLVFTAPHGLQCLFDLAVKPTEGNDVPHSVYLKRVTQKRWKQIWPKLDIDV